MANMFLIGVALISVLFGCCAKDSVRSKKANNQNCSENTASENKQEIVVQHNVTVNDTFFISRITEPYTDIVFIDKNRENDYYKALQQKVSPDISFVYEYLKSPLKKQNTRALPDEWIELIRYRNTFYVYRPSNDWYNVFRMNINDSLVISSYSDLVVKTLDSFKNVAGKRFELTITNVTSDPKNRVTEQLIVHKVDKKRQIYLFESRYPGNRVRYYFATPMSAITSFDLINIYNSEMKSHSSVEPDSINYPEFIRSL